VEVNNLGKNPFKTILDKGDNFIVSVIPVYATEGSACGTGISLKSSDQEIHVFPGMT
jgi:hypothetical protein